MLLAGHACAQRAVGLDSFLARRGRYGPGSRLFRYFHLATRPLGTHQSRQSHRDHVGRSDRAVLCAGGRDVLVARTPPDLGPVRYR